MSVVTENEDLDYVVECRPRSRTALLRGVMRLEHESAQTHVLRAIERELETIGSDPYTIDVTDVVFMNSSVFRALAAVVLVAKRERRRLVIVGRRSVPWQARTLASLAGLYDAVELRWSQPATAPTSSIPALRRDHDFWALETADGRILRFKDSKGFAYLERLLCQPGHELHVLELIGAESAGDAGPVLDERAKAEYRDRLDSARDELAEAEQFQDSRRAAKLREELEALSQQLAEAVGLGGRNRRAASDVQRARINVQRCLKESLERIAAADERLGRYFAATVKTGVTCSFNPL
jgi:hypothetical protein